jgi:hypothetical protein
LCNIINVELTKISDWFKLNKLSLNIKKTNFIVFRTRNNKFVDDCSLNIFIDCVKIEQVQKTKFLGVVINSQLSWGDHIKTVCNKISKSTGIICKIRRNLSQDSLLMLYRTLINPCLDYCNIVWAAESCGFLQYLFRKQKKAVRVISFSKWNAHTKSIFHRLKIMTLFDINKLQVCCFVYRALHGLLPIQFQELFSLNSDIHDHNTRQACKLHVISHSVKAREHSIRIYGSKLWNSLDTDITCLPSFNLFKKRCKALVFNKLL